VCVCACVFAWLCICMCVRGCVRLYSDSKRSRTLMNNKKLLNIAKGTSREQYGYYIIQQTTPVSNNCIMYTRYNTISSDKIQTTSNCTTLQQSHYPLHPITTTGKWIPASQCDVISFGTPHWRPPDSGVSTV